ncbi:hypothetical protein ACHQM5_005266 [Ranunculus cassubicifolius]
MKAAVWSELEVDLSAEEMWAVYSSPDLPRLIVELMPTYFERIDYVEGQGNQGTVSGGHLDIGFTLYENIFQITARSKNSCTVRATLSFDINEESQSNSSLITAGWGMATVIRDYIKAQKATACA